MNRRTKWQRISFKNATNHVKIILIHVKINDDDRKVFKSVVCKFYAALLQTGSLCSEKNRQRKKNVTGCQVKFAYLYLRIGN